MWWLATRHVTCHVSLTALHVDSHIDGDNHISPYNQYRITHDAFVYG